LIGLTVGTKSLSHHCRIYNLEFGKDGKITRCPLGTNRPDFGTIGFFSEYPSKEIITAGNGLQAGLHRTQQITIQCPRSRIEAIVSNSICVRL
jgi:hypothetical protein